MSTIKRLVCLANSRKHHGRCIAGKNTENRKWIRPISSRPNGEGSEHERQYIDGSDPRVMDIMDVALLDPKPDSYQQENWRIRLSLFGPWGRAHITDPMTKFQLPVQTY